jgi:hypothetical protein
VSRTPDPRDQAGSAVPFQGGVHQAGPQRIQRSLVRARREVLGTGNRLWACVSRSQSILAVCVSYHCIVRGSRADLCSNLGPGSPSSGGGSRLIPLFRPYQQSNNPARVNGPGFQGVQFHTSRLSRAIGGEGGRLKCLLGCGGRFPGRSAGPGLRSHGSSGEDGVFALRARGEGDRFPSLLRPDPAARVGCPGPGRSRWFTVMEEFVPGVGCDWFWDGGDRCRGSPRDRACARMEAPGRMDLSRCARGEKGDRFPSSLRPDPAAARCHPGSAGRHSF